MRARIGNTLSDPLTIKGGSPQGTLLGNLLFTLTTDKIEEDPDAADEEADDERTDDNLDGGPIAFTPVGVKRTILMMSGMSAVCSEKSNEFLARAERTQREQNRF